MSLQNPAIAFEEKSRFPCLYYIISVVINGQVLHENTYVLGDVAKLSLREETVMVQYGHNSYLAFFPKDAYSPIIEYQIAFEENKWLVFEIDTSADLENFLSNTRKNH